MSTVMMSQKAQRFLLPLKEDKMWGDGVVNAIMVFIKWGAPYTAYDKIGVGIAYDPLDNKFYLLKSYTEARNRNHPSGDGLMYYNVTDLGVVPESKSGFAINDAEFLRLLEEIDREILSKQENEKLVIRLTEFATHYRALLESKEQLVQLSSLDHTNTPFTHVALCV